MNTRYFVLDGESSEKYGITMQGYPSFSAPVPKVTKVSVPARNGDLIFYEDAFENIEGTLKCFLLQGQAYDFLADANIWLSKTGYRKFSYDGDDLAFRLARVVNAAECSVRMYHLDPFEIKLDCKPQRFLLSGENVITFTDHHTYFDCPAYSGLPLLRIYGTDNSSLSINGKQIALNTINEYVDVDCDLQDAYKGLLNCNANISCSEFPKLVNGRNVMLTSLSISKVEMIPRWFTI